MSRLFLLACLFGLSFAQTVLSANELYSRTNHPSFGCGCGGGGGGQKNDEIPPDQK